MAGMCGNLEAHINLQSWPKKGINRKLGEKKVIDIKQIGRHPPPPPPKKSYAAITKAIICVINCTNCNM